MIDPCLGFGAFGLQPRPWREFFGEFKTPKHVADRVLSNIEYYHVNYFLSVVAWYWIAWPVCFAFVSAIGVVHASGFVNASREQLLRKYFPYIGSGFAVLGFLKTPLLFKLVGPVSVLLHALFKARSIHRIAKDRMKEM
eukprot:GEMP01028727.1.p1 GENE.GEMP01028727.1~~GEMP01028727.1.p1  ORF type:complete len:149 (+),score=14.56 GEMP01028727.1:32-448(+)